MSQVSHFSAGIVFQQVREVVGVRSPCLKKIMPRASLEFSGAGGRGDIGAGKGGTPQYVSIAVAKHAIIANAPSSATDRGNMVPNKSLTKKMWFHHRSCKNTRINCLNVLNQVYVTYSKEIQHRTMYLS